MFSIKVGDSLKAKRLPGDMRLATSELAFFEHETLHKLFTEPRKYPDCKQREETAEESQQKEAIEQGQRGEKADKKEEQAESFRLNQPALRCLRRELPDELFYRFCYNLDKD